MQSVGFIWTRLRTKDFEKSGKPDLMPLSFTTRCQLTALKKWWAPKLVRSCIKELQLHDCLPKLCYRSLAGATRWSSTTWVVSSSSNHVKSVQKSNASHVLNIGQRESLHLRTMLILPSEKQRRMTTVKCDLLSTPYFIVRKAHIAVQNMAVVWEGEKAPVRIDSWKISEARLLSRITDGKWVDERKVQILESTRIGRQALNGYQKRKNKIRE